MIDPERLNPFRVRQAKKKTTASAMAEMRVAADVPRATQKVDAETLARMRGEPWPPKPT